MKKTFNQNQDQPKQMDNNKKRADNKNALDSREGEEQLYKGDDTTNNQKQKQSAKTSTGKK